VESGVRFHHCTAVVDVQLEQLVCPLQLREVTLTRGQWLAGDARLDQSPGAQCFDRQLLLDRNRS
jgi:hypothetical protein